jgi:hypothetical protein
MIRLATFHMLPIWKHFTNVVIIFYIKIWLMHLYMSITLYSHCNTPTCFSPQRAMLRKYWYISWARSTKYVFWCKLQIKEQLAKWSILVKLRKCFSLYTQQHIPCYVTIITLKHMLLFNLIFPLGHVFCWPESWNISVLSKDGPLGAETCTSISMWIKWC